MTRQALSISPWGTALTEAQHSRVVEMTAALRDFLSSDGSGVETDLERSPRHQTHFGCSILK
jgi:hypothetical protein